MLSSLRRLVILAAGLSFVGCAPPVLASKPAVTSAAPSTTHAAKRSLFGGVRGSSGLFGRKGAGVRMARQQRAVRKKRGVVRNRINHR